MIHVITKSMIITNDESGVPGMIVCCVFRRFAAGVSGTKESSIERQILKIARTVPNSSTSSFFNS